MYAGPGTGCGATSARMSLVRSMTVYPELDSIAGRGGDASNVVCPISKGLLPASTPSAVPVLLRGRVFGLTASSSGQADEAQSLLLSEGVRFSFCFLLGGTATGSRTGECLRLGATGGFVDRFVEDPEGPKKAETGSCPPPTESGINVRGEPETHGSQQKQDDRPIAAGHAPGRAGDA